MKRAKIMLLLAGEAAVCLLALILNLGKGDVFTALLRFPWLYLAHGLRALSLSGRVGDAVAILGYLAFSLLPLACLGLRRRRGAGWGEQALLGLLSLFLLGGLYLLINPACLSAWLGWPDLAGLGELALCCLLWSALVCLALVRVLPLLDKGGVPALLQGLSWLLLAIALALVWSVAGQGLGEMLQAWSQVRAANTAPVDLQLTLLLLILRWLGGSLPACLCLGVVYRADTLLQQLQADPYGEGALAAALGLARLCRLSVLVIAVAALALNLLQLLLGGGLHDLSLQIYLPLSQLALAWAALLFARLTAAGRELKTDNELFV